MLQSQEIMTIPGNQHVYIAGKMRGVYAFNFPAFDEAACELRSQGHVVFSPAERDRNNGFDPVGMMGTDQELATSGFSLREAMADDVDWICRYATAIYMLPGWSTSLGATAERSLAMALGLHIYGAPA